MSSIPVDLSADLSPKTHATLLRLADEFGLNAHDVSHLCWLIELMKHIPDRSHNFPTGKYNTITACQHIVQGLAQRVAGMRYNRDGQ